MNRPESVDIPDYSEINGAAFGIARLHSLYKLNSEKMFKKGIIESTLADMSKMTSKPSVIRLSSKYF